VTNTTETYWEVDGSSLQTYAYNIVTLGGDREAPPRTRGSDITVPFKPGSNYVRKIVESRVVTLGMWVVGANPDGTIPTNENLRRTYDRNWRQLRRLLWQPRRQFTLTKRFWVETADLTAAGVNTAPLPKEGLWSLITVVARASFAGGLNPQMSGPARSSFTVDLLLSDPYFYGDEIRIPFSTAPADALNPGPTRTVSILGDAETTYVEMDFTGPITSPRFTNLSADGNLYAQYGTAVADGETATVRAHNFSATHYPAGASYKTSGFVSHDGDKFWMYLEPGSTNLSLTRQSGTGTAAIRYRPVWL